MPALHVLRVFVNEDAEWGNPLGVFLDGMQIPKSRRQEIAADLGFSETVFVEDRAGGAIRIHTPAVELPFAGHPSVGTAWLLLREGTPVETLRPPAGEVRVRREGREGREVWEVWDRTFIAARPEWAPRFDRVRFDSPAEVRELSGAPDPVRNTYAWAWVDEAAGTIRARSFVPEEGIVEDEATGSAALVLCAQLNRPLTVHQGHGSVIECRPAGDGWIEVGGKVVLDEVREQPLSRTPR